MENSVRSAYEQELIDKVSSHKDSYLIWACGHKEFNINDDNVCSFNVNNEHSLQNICEYNKIFNEFTCWYYVWKNNLKTKYVATAHYNKIPTKIDPEKLDEDFIQYFKLIHRFNYKTERYYSKEFALIHNQMFELCAPEFIFDDILEYLHTQKTIDINDIIQYTKYTNSGYSIAQAELFGAKWDIYCDLIKFIDDYLKFIANKYNLKNLEDWKNHIANNVCSHYIDSEYMIQNNFMNMCYQPYEKFKTIHNDDFGYSEMNNCWRIYGYTIEILISVYIMTHKHFL